MILFGNFFPVIDGAALRVYYINRKKHQRNGKHRESKLRRRQIMKFGVQELIIILIIVIIVFGPTQIPKLRKAFKKSKDKEE